MLVLLAQAASTSEWHDGWQLAVTTITALTVVVGWLHRQSKSDLKSVKDDLSTRITDVKDDLSTRITDVKDGLKAEVVSAETRLKAEITRVETDLKADIARVEADVARVEANIAEVGGDLKDLKDKLYDDARSQAAMYQWQLAATRPATSEASPQQPPPQPKQLAETSTS